MRQEASARRLFFESRLILLSTELRDGTRNRVVEASIERAKVIGTDGAFS